MGVWHVVCVWAYKSFASEHLTHKIENQNPFQVLPKTGQKKNSLQLLANNICAHSVKISTQKGKLWWLYLISMIFMEYLTKSKCSYYAIIYFMFTLTEK